MPRLVPSSVVELIYPLYCIYISLQNMSWVNVVVIGNSITVFTLYITYSSDTPLSVDVSNGIDHMSAPQIYLLMGPSAMLILYGAQPWKHWLRLRVRLRMSLQSNDLLETVLIQKQCTKNWTMVMFDYLRLCLSYVCKGEGDRLILLFFSRSFLGIPHFPKGQNTN